jgi:hypothetical protein
LSAFSPRTSLQQKIECRYYILIQILHYLSICSVDVLSNPFLCLIMLFPLQLFSRFMILTATGRLLLMTS